MLTIFTTPKPFRGHINVIQRNALKSWTLLDPDVEVILFGNEEGAAEAARELGIRHEAHVERNEFGTNLLDSMFGKAEAIARHDVLCYVNCDIVLTDDFRRAVERMRAEHRRFLMVGRRWDTPITQPMDFSDSGWGEKACSFALSANAQRDEWWIDYFVFTRGLYTEGLPPFAVGRAHWDNWMVWKALKVKSPVVDASPAVVAVHQNHDYKHLPQGKVDVWEGEEARRNLRLAGGRYHQRTIADANMLLRPDGLHGNPKRYLAAVKRLYHPKGRPIWFFLLDVTRPIRGVLGLRSRAMRNSRPNPSQ
jgi:hypothetical protein